MVVLDAPDLLQARSEAAVSGKDLGLEFASGYQLDQLSAERIPANMIGRLLNQGDLRKLQRLPMKLQRMLLKKKPLGHQCDDSRGFAFDRWRHLT